MKAYAVIVLQHGTLQNEEPRLPSTKVLTPFCEVAFLVTGLEDRLLRIAHNVGGKESNDFIIALDREIYERL